MSEPLTDAVNTLRVSAEMLGEAGRRLATLDPGRTAFGAGGPGRLGGLGVEFYLHWRRALDARIREALAHGGRLDEISDRVSAAAAGYVDVDDSASRSWAEGT